MKVKNKGKKSHHEAFLGGETHASPIFGKSKKKRSSVVDEEDNAGDEEATWIYTYGDLVTLLLLFFVMLFAISTISEEKFQALKEAIDSKKGKAIGIIDKIKEMSEEAESSGNVDYVRKVKIGNAEDIELAQMVAQSGQLQISQIIQSLEYLEEQMDKKETEKSRKIVKQIKNNLEKETKKLTSSIKKDFKELIVKIPHGKVFNSDITLSTYAKSFITSMSRDFIKDKKFRNIHIQVLGNAEKSLITNLRGRTFKMNESSVQAEMLKSFFKQNGLKESLLSFEAKSYPLQEETSTVKEVVFRIRKTVL